MTIRLPRQKSGVDCTAYVFRGQHEMKLMENEKGAEDAVKPKLRGSD